MFLRNDHGYEFGGGGLVVPAPAVMPSAPRTEIAVRRALFGEFDFAPDLGSHIGSSTWFRGVATCLGLCALTLLLAPGMENPIHGTVPAPLNGADWDAARTQAISPLGQGASTGYRMAATRLVAPLADTPERPIINLDARLASGDALLRVLRRTGVSQVDAEQVGALVTQAVALDEIQPGTTLDITLGRRFDKSQPRPLENMAFRAKFDLKLEVARADGALTLKEIPIAIDRTPLRVQGVIGSSLYRSARAAGAPAKSVEAFIRTVASRVPVSKLGSGCKFDIIVKQARAETGEVQLGELLYAGVTGCSAGVQLLPWERGGKKEWFDTSGKGETTGMMAMPVAGRITSGYGYRIHPLLRFKRMHKGMDFGAPYGAPIYAASDGVVAKAGRNGGYGNFVKIDHGSGYATGYGHMSKIAVRNGTRVRRGQVIGYVGSSGMSTGPHLHYELYKNGQAVNPRSISFTSMRRLTGGDLSEFKSRLRQLQAVPVGHGAAKQVD